MIKRNRIVFQFLIIAFLIGCSSMDVPSTDDPHKMLSNALKLVQQQRQPFAAEKLIQEAKQIFVKNNDKDGAARANWAYAIFLQSKSVESMQELYEIYGFLDKGVTFRDRYHGALTYFYLTEALAPHGDYSFISALYLDEAFYYYKMNDPFHVCRCYKLSLRFRQKAYEKNPNIKFSTPILGGTILDKEKTLFYKYVKAIPCQ